jgi:hypothetical protein
MNFQEWDVPKILHLPAPTKNLFRNVENMFAIFILKRGPAPILVIKYIYIKGNKELPR